MTKNNELMQKIEKTVGKSNFDKAKTIINKEAKKASDKIGDAVAKKIKGVDGDKIENQIRSLKDDYYEQSKKAIEKYLKNGFKNPIRKNDFDIEEFSLDNFYIISYNLILSNLQNENSDFNPNFFKNICEPLFKEDKLLFKAIEFFYNPTKYNEIKKSYKINSNNIKSILLGYRYCLNELSNKNKKGIYYPLYDSNNYQNYLQYHDIQFYC